MKNTLVLIAIALASGLLVASGALAGGGYFVTEPQGSRPEVDIMGPGYTTSEGQAGTEEMAPAGSSEEQAPEELAPAASRPEVDIMGPGYTTSEGQAGAEEMAPAGSSGKQAPEEIAPSENQSY